MHPLRSAPLNKMAYPVHSPLNLPSYPSRQNKVIMQRQYREKEGECFTTLRDVIKQVSGEELQTRQEILRKAIDLLVKISEARRQGTTEVVSPVQYGMLPFTNPADMTGAQALLDYSAQSFQWSETWWASAESAEQSAYYTAQLPDQQYDTLSDTTPALVPASYQEYGEGWPAYRRL